MTIKNNNSNESVLIELGNRLASERLRQGSTQAALAHRSGVSKRTIERIESGHSAQFGSVISLLRALSLLDRLEQLTPLEQLPPTGLFLGDIPLQRGTSGKRRRAKSSLAAKPAKEATFDY